MSHPRSWIFILTAALLLPLLGHIEALAVPVTLLSALIHLWPEVPGAVNIPEP